MCPRQSQLHCAQLCYVLNHFFFILLWHNSSAVKSSRGEGINKIMHLIRGAGLKMVPLSLQWRIEVRFKPFDRYIGDPTFRVCQGGPAVGRDLFMAGRD